jgi:hypothetical protein
MHELAGDPNGTVGALFQPPADQPFCTAVLAGIHPGRVFVDDANQPRTALVTRDDGWCFLRGDPDNEGFNQAVNRAIWDREIVSPKASMLLSTCRPEECKGSLGDVFAP